MPVSGITEMLGAPFDIAENIGNWLARRPFFLSVDEVHSRQAELTQIGEAIYIRAKVEATRYAQADERCNILLQRMWRDGVLIEWEKSPLQWAGHNSFEPLCIMDTAWVNICAVYPKDPTRVTVCTARACMQTFRCNEAGRYTFEIVAGSERGLNSTIRFSVAHNPNYSGRPLIKSVESCRKPFGNNLQVPIKSERNRFSKPHFLARSYFRQY
jgi:hypothetical protein